MERLSGLDALAVNAEAGAMNIHITALLVIDPHPAGADFDEAHLYDYLCRRLPLNPLLRRRLVHKPLRLGQPVFVDDPDFDVRRHLYRGAVRAPGGPVQVAEQLDEIHRHRLAHDKPLWEAWILEGLADGRLGVAVKFSHTMSDGVGAVTRLLPTVLSDGPGRDIDYPQPQPAPELPGAVDLLADWARESAGVAIESMKVVGLGGPRLARGVAERLVAMATGPLRRWVGDDAPEWQRRLGAAPARTRLNLPISERRNTAYATVPLAELRELGEAFGVSVNDVFLAAALSAMRSWLQRHDALPDAPLQAFVPISTRREGDDSPNSWSLALVRLPVFVADPVERLELIHATTHRVKSRRGGHGPSVDFADLISLVPPRLLGAAAAAYVSDELAGVRPPFFHAACSNVPGPREALWLDGAKLEQIFPMGPLFVDMNLNMTAVSYDGGFGLGVAACPDNVPDAWEIVDGWLAGLDELKACAQRDSNP